MTQLWTEISGKLREPTFEEIADFVALRWESRIVSREFLLDLHRLGARASDIEAETRRTP